MSEEPQRKLAAILSADVVGYSRLMGADEAGTLATMRAHRTELWNPTIQTFGGRVVGTAGDSILVEFASAVAAVQTSIVVQRGMVERNADLPNDKTMLLRIGINIGEVIVEGDDIYGDGINVAARLQEIAEPGGIAVSGNIHEQIEGKLDGTFVDDGQHQVKNIVRPVHVWRWSPLQGQAPVADSVDAPLTLPDKPSIAVLPFDNMSGDPEQEYFSDGITEDIITALSKFRWFFVSARNSTFVYKGQAADIKQVGRDLGVRYVLEGSVRKAGNRIRVSAQLIEAETGNHVWAERYDRDLKDIFELQDEITDTIAAAVEPELSGFERERALRKPTENLGAWGLFQQGVALSWRQDRANVKAGIKLMHQAVELDPNFGQAYGYMAFGSYSLLMFGWADDREATLRQGMTHANRAIAIDQRDYFAHFALGRLHTLAGDRPAAIRALETSVTINPNFAHGYYGLAAAHVYGGDAEKAIESADLAIRLSPNDPLMWTFLTYKGLAHYALGDLDQAIELLERCYQFPTAQFIPFVWLTAMYVHVGREQDASKALENARRLEPDLSIAFLRGIFRNAQGKRAKRLFDALRKAGLPEQ